MPFAPTAEVAVGLLAIAATAGPLSVIAIATGLKHYRASAAALARNVQT